MTILCRNCNKPIAKKEDLITAFYGFKIRAFHAACYSDWLRTSRTFFLNNYPINSIGWTLRSIVMAAFGLLFTGIYIFMLIYKSSEMSVPILIFMPVWILLALSGVFYRIYSYSRYEKHLK